MWGADVSTSAAVGATTAVAVGSILGLTYVVIGAIVAAVGPDNTSLDEITEAVLDRLGILADAVADDDDDDDPRPN